MNPSKVIKLLLNYMFNPQRKSKLVQIKMQQRAFQLHLQKMEQIKHSPSPLSVPQSKQTAQRRYLDQLHLKKLDIQARKSSDLYRENNRLFLKLMQTDKKPHQHLKEVDILSKHNHHNHYYNKRSEEERIKQENSGMIGRLVNQTSFIPSLQQMKRDFSQSKQYAKMVRKLPAILKHEERFKRDLSLKRLNESIGTMKSSRQKLTSQRRPSEEMNYLQPIEQALLQPK